MERAPTLFGTSSLGQLPPSDPTSADRIQGVVTSLRSDLSHRSPNVHTEEKQKGRDAGAIKAHARTRQLLRKRLADRQPVTTSTAPRRRPLLTTR